MNTHDTSEAISADVVMDEVICQDDNTFKTFFDRVVDGSFELSDVE